MTSHMVYLCPSDRSARAFTTLLAARDIAPPDCVDIERFCRELWQRGQLFGLISDAREWVDTAASHALWRHVVSEETELSVSEITRVATLASDAWALAHRYAFPLKSLENLLQGSDNLSLFARCALRMQSLLKLRRGVTQPELAPALLLVLESLRSLLPSRVVLTPAFAANTAHTRLLAAMTRLGVLVEPWVEPQRDDVPTVVYRFNDAAQEMHAAIFWASRALHALRERDASGDASPNPIAIVVPDLSSQRSMWLSALREQLNPDAWWLNPETDRDCFNLSVGLCLGEYPHIHCLITVLRAAYATSNGNTDTELLAQALMHPRWGRTPESLKRIEQQQAVLLERGIDQSTFADWWDVLPPTVAQCATLSAAQRRNDTAFKQTRASRAAHAATIADTVQALTERAMIAQSDLFQLDTAWTEAIKGWTQLDRWLPPITKKQAVAELAQLANQQTFQPKAGPARIQVMGLLESAGVPLAAAWITGFTADVLPESFKPNPMLPMAWQAANYVGLGSRDEVRRRAGALWANWRALTDSLRVSYTCESDGVVRRLSTLASNLVVEARIEPSTQSASFASRSMESVADEALPARLTTNATRPLSSSDIERQAHCPRKAAASFMRLREWPEHVLGISPRVRGTLVHEVMAAIGEARMRGILDGAGEPDFTTLRAVASDAFTRAVTIAAAKRSRIPPAVWNIERERLLPLIDQVIALDAARDGFRVVNVEEEVQAQLFNTSFKLRVDRVDDYAAALADDDQFGVVLDYKTGAVSRADWFAENSSGRLAAPQLPLYLFALHAIMPADAPRIGAIGYIIISDDDVKFIGLGADASLATKKPGKDEPDWYELTTQWKDQLGQLVGEIEGGVADVAPLKGRATCRVCQFASFCREPWSLAGGGSDAADADDEIGADGGSAA